MSKLKLIIFDMDGLMFDTEKIGVSTWIKAGETHGYQITEQHVLRIIGLNKQSSMSVFKELFGDSFPYEDLYNTRVTSALEIIEKNGVPIKEGLYELLEYLEEKGLKKAVATSTSRERAVSLLSKAGILNRFDTILCGDEVTNGKPNPEIFLKVCEKLNVNPDEALVLEDSEMGLLAAHAAGIKCIVIPDLKKPSEENEKIAHAIFKSLIELKESGYI